MGRVARGAGVAILTLMRVFVARGAIRIELAEKCARQDLALPRFVALGAFNFGVAADQCELCVSVMIKLQFLAMPTLGRVAGFALRPHLRVVRIFMTVRTLRKFELRVMSDIMLERPSRVTLVAFQLKMLALKFEGGTIMIKFLFL